MASNQSSLDAAATERKARLAKLKSLKRKQPSTSADDENDPQQPKTSSLTEDPTPSFSTPPSETPKIQHLSLRNYDPVTRGPKLGFEAPPTQDTETLEERAAAIATDAKEKEAEEGKEEKPIDLFTLQPKKPNWDLKRDVARKMEVLGARTDNAIARMVRERVEGAKRRERERNGNGDGEKGGEDVGIGGVDLVEGVHVREREEEEERRAREEEEERRAREEDDD